ncbi:MAG: hypothetical protein H5T69_01450 [Chloroflexi bacterium]|nr:hypothetical protein [Chloroflexota bacterium]
MSMSTEQATEKVKTWELVGPISSGGTVFGLAISPTEDVRRYWAATGCGIFYSDDGGASWRQNLTGLTTPLLSALAVSPTGALFAGALSGELFSSFDYGRTWEAGLIPEELRAMVTALVASPNFRRDGTCFAATDGGGVLVTRNSGQSWEDSSFGLGSASVLALTSSPDWSAREIMFAATTEGVFVSRNGGRAWRETELMLSDDVVDILAVSPAFEQDNTVYAGTESGQLYVSHNAGRTWDLLQERLGEGPVNALWLAPDFHESGHMLAGVGPLILVSTDRGASWAVSARMPGAVLTLVGNQEVILAGLHDAGVYQSTDRGATWRSSSQGLAARGFARLLAVGDTLYAMGPQEGLWKAELGTLNWEPVEGLEAYIPLSAVYAGPDEEQIFVVSQEDGILRSLDGGRTWEIVSQVPGVQALTVLPDGTGWAGTIDGHLLKSTDGGENWDEVNSPCDGQEVLAIVASPAYAQDHTLFMGTAIAATGNRPARVALWRSTNGGEDWRQLTTQTTTARWMDIAMPTDVNDQVAEQAVVATGPYCLRPLRRAKDVWISTRVDPGGANVLSVVVVGEVDQGGTLYAATGNGIYRSIDGGRTWQPFSGGLTVTSFIGLIAQREEEITGLYALSLGGLLWQREIS